MAVAKCYYKSNYDIEVFLKDIGGGTADENIVLDRDPDKSSKRGRKLKIKKGIESKVKSTNNGSAVKREGKMAQNAVLVDETDLFDYLVSPLKQDFEFGSIIRDLVY